MKHVAFWTTQEPLPQTNVFLFGIHSWYNLVPNLIKILFWVANIFRLEVKNYLHLTPPPPKKIEKKYYLHRHTKCRIDNNVVYVVVSFFRHRWDEPPLSPNRLMKEWFHFSSFVLLDRCNNLAILIFQTCIHCDLDSARSLLLHTW